jgi:hypothetical protein
MREYRISYMIMKYNEFKNILQKLLIKMFRLNSLKRKSFKKKEWKKKRFSKKLLIKTMTKIKTVVKKKVRFIKNKKEE